MASSTATSVASAATSAASAATSVAYVTLIYSDYRKNNEFEVVGVDCTKELALARAEKIISAHRDEDDGDDDAGSDDGGNDYVFAHGVVIRKKRLGGYNGFFSPMLVVIEAPSGPA